MPQKGKSSPPPEYAQGAATTSTSSGAGAPKQPALPAARAAPQEGRVRLGEARAQWPAEEGRPEAELRAAAPQPSAPAPRAAAHCRSAS
mmetsp:Transcript_93751/g.301785  ORF Transcript_93751/g.301785 Transcript_93751/m.301785 type:complete len:89 (+) Transcript_93751:211-477(+)